MVGEVIEDLKATLLRATVRDEVERYSVRRGGDGPELGATEAAQRRAVLPMAVKKLQEVVPATGELKGRCYIFRQLSRALSGDLYSKNII